MNKEKLLYEAPTAQTFVVRFEGVICGSPNGGFGDSPNVDDQSGDDDWYSMS